MAPCSQDGISLQGVMFPPDWDSVFLQDPQLRLLKALQQWETSRGGGRREFRPLLFNSKLVQKLLVLWGVTHRIATLLPSLPRIGTPFSTHKAWQHCHLRAGGTSGITSQVRWSNWVGGGSSLQARDRKGSEGTVVSKFGSLLCLGKQQSLLLSSGSHWPLGISILYLPSPWETQENHSLIGTLQPLLKREAGRGVPSFSPMTHY